MALALPSKLKMRHLLLLKTLGAAPSVRKAAIALNMRQLTASTLLRELEDAFEFPLFEKGDHGLKATNAGTAAIRWASLILSDLENVCDDLEDIAQGATTTIRLGISPAVAPVLLPRTFVELLRAYPKTTVSVESGTVHDMTPRLLAGKLDCIVVLRLSASAEPMLTSELLYSETTEVIVGANHPLANRKRLSPTDLDYHNTWVLGAVRGENYEGLAREFQEMGCMKPRVVMETNSTVLTLRLLQAGDCISALQSRVVRQYMPYGIIKKLPVKLRRSECPVVLITPANTAPTSRAHGLLLDLLKKTAKGV
jgi:DNA-binding transcriptional LysR family regulator